MEESLLSEVLRLKEKFETDTGQKAVWVHIPRARITEFVEANQRMLKFPANSDLTQILGLNVIEEVGKGNIWIEGEPEQTERTA